MVFLNPRQANHKSAVPGFRAFFWREGGKAQRPFSRRVFAQLAGFAGAAAGVVAGVVELCSGPEPSAWAETNPVPGCSAGFAGTAGDVISGC